MPSVEQRDSKCSKEQKNITLDTEKKISCDDLKIGIGKHESEGIVLNVLKDLKGTLVRMTTQMWCRE